MRTAIALGVFTYMNDIKSINGGMLSIALGLIFLAFIQDIFWFFKGLE